MNTSITTDEMDKTDPSERYRLVGFCERHQEWYKFIDNPNDPKSRQHPECGEMPSSKIGFQITSQRSFDPKAKRMTKAQLRKMSSTGA